MEKDDKKNQDAGARADRARDRLHQQHRRAGGDGVPRAVRPREVGAELVHEPARLITEVTALDHLRQVANFRLAESGHRLSPQTSPARQMSMRLSVMAHTRPDAILCSVSGYRLQSSVDSL